MNMKTIKRIGALAVCALAALPSLAQQTYQEMEQLTINENVTTVITASEPVPSLTSPRMPSLETNPSTTPSGSNQRREPMFMPTGTSLPLLPS